MGGRVDAGDRALLARRQQEEAWRQAREKILEGARDPQCSLAALREAARRLAVDQVDYRGELEEGNRELAIEHAEQQLVAELLAAREAVTRDDT